ncbi:hypothetical protein EDD76_11623 [Kineothrix alysoides]|uniref:Secreted protein n=2 Tax=Kineothrix alysoides TaxID=1469948 RepID=A0A4R1QQL2_9FIRM|nr:hypothetical protein EDD76_11623 [Kineothrix alysoides]
MIIYMKRKRIIAAALFAAGTLGLTACGSASSASSSASAAPAHATMEVVEEANAATAATVPTAPATPSVSVAAFGSSENTITVNSNEKVTVVPDIAQVVYSVQTQAKDAAGCQSKNSEDVNKVIEQLKALGIAEASIQTSDYYMYPIYDYSGNTQKITGYQATATLTVSGLPIDDLGNILTQSVSTGINNIQSITYQSSRYDSAYQEALKLAVGSAKTKALALAEAGECTIGSVANIVENSNYGEARYTDNALSSKMNASVTKEMLADTGANIMPGEMDVEVNITVEYFIQ